jgi:hypothetical protein
MERSQAIEAEITHLGELVILLGGELADLKDEVHRLQEAPHELAPRSETD